jgi:hypothetical protein
LRASATISRLYAGQQGAGRPSGRTGIAEYQDFRVLRKSGHVRAELRGNRSTPLSCSTIPGTADRSLATIPVPASAINRRHLDDLFIRDAGQANSAARISGAWNSRASGRRPGARLVRRVHVHRRGVLRVLLLAVAVRPAAAPPTGRDRGHDGGVNTQLEDTRGTVSDPIPLSAVTTSGRISLSVRTRSVMFETHEQDGSVGT